VPAALRGGHAYADAILWSQTADRLVDSIAHARAWWWYAPLLPVMLFPWAVWPPVWRGLARRVRRPDPGELFVLAWLLPSVGILSVISGKQPHYLLPVVPAFALLAARALHSVMEPDRRWRMVIPGLCIAALGLGLVAAAGVWPEVLPLSWEPLHVFWGVGLVALGLLLTAWRLPPALAEGAVAMAGVATLVLSLGAVMQAGRAAFDLRPIAEAAARLQALESPVAYLGSYNAEFAFAGRLQRPITRIHSHTASSWMKDHPEGYVMVRTEDPPPDSDANVLLRRPYRGGWLEIWPVHDLLQHPDRWAR
jgi:4-amino-4-deoxy-L-arabinose transferase-like glycosyltransferase